MPAPLQPIPTGALERLSQVIGEAFTGSVVDGLLQQARIPIDRTHSTKWRRVLASLEAEQSRTSTSAAALKFVTLCAEPARCIGNTDGHRSFCDDLNEALAFGGWQVSADGGLTQRTQARTLDETTQRARRLRDEVSRRGGHAAVFRYCNAELLAGDCYTAVFETLKGLCDRLRSLSGIDEDGHRLIAAALEGDSPLLVINAYSTATQKNEQRGVANLIKGVYSAFRSTSAHEPRIIWTISEANALDLLGTLSLIHRRLDGAVRVPRR